MSYFEGVIGDMYDRYTPEAAEQLIAGLKQGYGEDAVKVEESESGWRICFSGFGHDGEIHLLRAQEKAPSRSQGQEG